MNRVESYWRIGLTRLNRLARQAHVGAEDAVWLEEQRGHAKLHHALTYPQLISQLQDIFGLELVTDRLTS